MVFDGDCGFCRQWIARWKEATAGRVDYAPFQEVAEARFPEIPVACFKAAVRVIGPAGRVTGGGEAVFRTLARRARFGSGLWQWLYENLPGFGWVTETAYGFIARHRELAGWVTRMLWGRGPQAVCLPTFKHAARWFLRVLGVVYLIAFVSLWTQVDGLIGSRGILPVAPWLEAAHAQLGAQAYLLLPTLCWLNASDGFLHFLCGGGAVLAALLIVGLAPALGRAVGWAVYISLTIAGQTFLSFQWDILLLETGFLSIFLVPPTQLWPRRLGEFAPTSRVVSFLLRWLLFRLMLMSGVVKLTSGDSAWWDRTALSYHYETQPLPTPLGWWAHGFPAWLGSGSVALMFFAELLVPFLIFAPRRPRLFAAAVLVALQVAIALTGNYCFFNLLTAALCLWLVDDAVWPGRKQERDAAAVETHARGWPRWVQAPLAAVILVFSLPLLWNSFFPRAEWPRPLATAYGFIEGFRSLNGYGLFRVMTRTRPEIVVEGSADGETWLPYEFRYKPGDSQRRPPIVAPHQPRLDWQMWFAALSDVRRTPWFIEFLVRLLQNRPEVVALLERNPFPDAPPRFVRARLYEYKFTDRAERERTGAWWRREERGLYCPAVSLRQPAR